MPTTVTIPGGTAVLREPKELTVGGRRALMLHFGRLDQESAKAIVAALEGDDPTALNQLTLAQQEALLTMPDAGIFAVLASWTRPEPIPASVADVALLTTDVYDALVPLVQPLASQVLGQAPQWDDPEGDPNTSPTGAFAGSNGPSRASAKAPSDRKKPNAGRSTSTGRKSPAG